MNRKVDLSSLRGYQNLVDRTLEKQDEDRIREEAEKKTPSVSGSGRIFSAMPDDSTSREMAKDASTRFYLRLLAPELSEEGITEIAFNNPASHTIFVEKYGRWEERPFRIAPANLEKEVGITRLNNNDPPLPDKVQTQANYDYVNSLSVAVAQFNNSDIKESSPVLSATLPDGERAQFVRPPACLSGHISMTIRRPSLEVRTPESYRDGGFYDELRPVSNERAGEEELCDLYGKFFDKECRTEELRQIRSQFMRRCVELGRTVVIAGSTGSGKTTYMKALMQYIPTSERIITIEDCPELVYGLPNHHNQVNLLYPSEAMPGDPITATKLMKSCLRMKPDRILLAELRGGETYDWINSVLSGHCGSITSCHAMNSSAVFDYLAMKTLENPVGRAIPNVKDLIRSVIDVIVHIQNNRGSRAITEVYFREYNERKNN